MLGVLIKGIYEQVVTESLTNLNSCYIYTRAA